jgi:hypothetical protein
MPLFELVTKYGEKRPKLRRELTLLAGGRAEFQKLRQQGAGGSRAPFGGKRQVGRVAKTAVIASIDDSKVPRIKGMRKKDGWTFRDIYVGPGKQTQVIIAKSPKTGKEYVRCANHEKADLIHTRAYDKWVWSHEPVLRFKLYVESKTAKKAAKEQKDAERREETGFERRLAKKQAKKRTKKVRRSR